MTPARGLSFLRFSRPPHQPHLPPHFPAPSSHLRSAISHPAPIFPHNPQPPPHPGHFSHPIFLHKKPGGILASGPAFSSLHTQQHPLHPRPVFLPTCPVSRRASAFPAPYKPPAYFPPGHFPPIPFSHTKSPEASRLRANISHVCPSLGTPFFRCRAAPYSLKSSSVNWEVRRGGATRGSRIRGSYW